MFSALAISVITLVYIILAWSGTSKLNKERKTLPTLKKYPKVSIIIPAYKSSGIISQTLKSAAALDYPNKEIIVVNDSKDSTPAIARSYGAKVIQNTKRLGKPNALNKATKSAKGELLFFLDADTTISKDCISKLVPWFSKPEVSVAMPKHLLRNKGFVSGLANLENTFVFAQLRIHTHLGSIAGFRGCSVMIRKKTIEKHPWPDTLLEDNHLAATLLSKGHKLIWEPEAITHTSEPDTFKELKHQKRRWGEGAYIAFHCHWKFYIRSPQFRTYFFPYLGLGILTGLLIFALILSFPLFPAFTTPIITELVLIFVAMYFHSLIIFFMGSRKLIPIQTILFMILYFPTMTYFYFRGVLSGIKRKKTGGCELHFRDW